MIGILHCPMCRRSGNWIPKKTNTILSILFKDDQYEEYYVLREQVAREPDAEILKEAAYEAPTLMARFAFCRLTKYSYPASWKYAYSYCTYECGWKSKVMKRLRSATRKKHLCFFMK